MGLFLVYHLDNLDWNGLLIITIVLVAGPAFFQKKTISYQMSDPICRCIDLGGLIPWSGNSQAGSPLVASISCSLRTNLCLLFTILSHPSFPWSPFYLYWETMNWLKTGLWRSILFHSGSSDSCSCTKYTSNNLGIENPVICQEQQQLSANIVREP